MLARAGSRSLAAHRRIGWGPSGWSPRITSWWANRWRGWGGTSILAMQVWEKGAGPGLSIRNCSRAWPGRPWPWAVRRRRPRPRGGWYASPAGRVAAGCCSARRGISSMIRSRRSRPWTAACGPVGRRHRAANSPAIGDGWRGAGCSSARPDEAAADLEELLAAEGGGDGDREARWLLSRARLQQGRAAEARRSDGPGRSGPSTRWSPSRARTWARPLRRVPPRDQPGLSGHPTRPDLLPWRRDRRAADSRGPPGRSRRARRHPHVSPRRPAGPRRDPREGPGLRGARWSTMPSAPTTGI